MVHFGEKTLEFFIRKTGSYIRIVVSLFPLLVSEKLKNDLNGPRKNAHKKPPRHTYTSEVMYIVLVHTYIHVIHTYIHTYGLNTGKSPVYHQTTKMLNKI